MVQAGSATDKTRAATVQHGLTSDTASYDRPHSILIFRVLIEAQALLPLQHCTRRKRRAIGVAESLAVMFCHQLYSQYTSCAQRAMDCVLRPTYPTAKDAGRHFLLCLHPRGAAPPSISTSTLQSRRTSSTTLAMKGSTNSLPRCSSHPGGMQHSQSLRLYVESPISCDGKVKDGHAQITIYYFQSAVRGFLF
ncbi:hypothetical protein BJV74DRAFT_552423 [Russula compacta]|nr:hypothetical protein BJV74DRAFT_552423 [Russula compacta]